MIWKEIEGYEGLYEVSDEGSVRVNERICVDSVGVVRVYKQHILRQERTRDGHLRVSLFKDGKISKQFVHRLMAKAFIPNPNNYPVINHIDGNPSHNALENLEWTTISENCKHAYRLGLCTIDKTREANSKSCIIYDKQWNIIASFPSMVEASKQTQIPLSTISYHCERCPSNPWRGKYHFRIKEKCNDYPNGGESPQKE